MKKTALIMAGGRGERFWPKSRANLPKQFLSLTQDGKTMIQQTVERILPLVEMEDIFIATNASYCDLVKEQLPDIPFENILCEPMSKNTAPCIGLGAIHIAKKYSDALMLVLPSDHIISYQNMFLQTVKDACEVAEEDTALATIGITPTFPETGYGYIKFNTKIQKKRAYQVERFVEKPNLDTAKQYLSSEEYLWNSGMFVWKTSSILGNVQEHMPETYDILQRILDSIGADHYQQVLEEEYQKFPSQSIDYGIMEKASNIYILSGTFGWDDAGSWLAVSRVNKSNEFGNVVSGNVISVNTKNSIIEGENRLIATVGVSDLVIVDTKDSVLICHKESTEEIKTVLQNLKICNRTEYL